MYPMAIGNVLGIMGGLPVYDEFHQKCTRASRCLLTRIIRGKLWRMMWRAKNGSWLGVKISSRRIRKGIGLETRKIPYQEILGVPKFRVLENRYKYSTTKGEQP
ncbi:F9C16.12 [Arabidopsis thaliana]|uniref:F9C16.12 n=1 Tax=Arabidopsis thaliana TaxID=3702 RepID=Q9LP06_ARATH|nr:F9C16.12 [Arabidopsis thaliana]